tara:strand:- start:1222 stop:2112 length:891 start_codon:yes stop_codon:yes gene_type:complete
MQENEFVILWTSGVKKIKLVNLFFVISVVILFFYLIFSTFITPSALNLSRNLLSKNNFSSFSPTIRVQQFSDSFKGFTFLVEEKINNEIKNVFIYDSANTLKNLNTTPESKKSTTIVAEKGLVEEKRMILFNGQIITSEKEKLKNSIIKFEQLNLDLKDLQTDTIKDPKLQETPTLDLVKCMFKENKKKILNCEEHTKKEIITILNRRIVLPLYIPIISLLCSFLLIKNDSKKNYFSNKFSIFFISFLILLYAELIIRYTGIYKIISILFFISPLILIPIIYTLLNFKLSKPPLIK